MKYRNSLAVLLAGLMACSGCFFVSCDEEDDYDTNQFSSGNVTVTAASLQLVRGGYMTVKGTNLNKVTSATYTGGATVTDITVDDERTIHFSVPEEAEPGVVTLTYSGGTVTTGEVAFTEPIEFTSFSPDSVTAGNVLTIKGTYLTYIDQVAFPLYGGDGYTYVEVAPTSRTEFTVTVPKAAASGELCIGYTEISGSDTIVTLLPCSGDNDYLGVTAPTVTADQSKTDIAPSDNVTITGANLDLIEQIILPGDIVLSEGDFTLAEQNTQITFSAPAEMQQGTVVLVAYSGQEIDAIAVTPISAALTAELTGKNGATIEGLEVTNLSVLSSVLFTDIDGNEIAADFTPDDESSTISITIPAAAVSGEVTLVSVSAIRNPKTFTTTKPAATTSDSSLSLNANETATFTGTDLDLVQSVTFPSGETAEVKAATDGESFTVTVPMTASGSGNTTVTMTNGETVESFQSVSVTAVSFAYIAELESGYEPAIAAEFAVTNIDVLESVYLNGELTNHMIYGTNQLFVYMPLSLSGKTVPLVLNSTIEAADGTTSTQSWETKVTINAIGEVETIVWEGSLDVSGWGGVTLPATFETPLDSRAFVRIRVSQANSDLQVMDGYWGMSSSWGITTDADKNIIYISADDLADGYEDITINFHDVDGNDWWDGTMMFNADGVTVTSVSYVIDYGGSAETTIWEGTFNIGSWSGFDSLAWGSYDWSSVTAGTTINITYTMNADAEGWGCISLRHGQDWGYLPDEHAKQTDVSEDGVVSYTLTQEDIDDLVANGGLIVSGANVTISKITLS